MNTNEIVLFETEDQEIKLSVPVEQDTVWLNQVQMTELFSTTKQNISLHINNCFREKEISGDTCIMNAESVKARLKNLAMEDSGTMQDKLIL